MKTRVISALVAAFLLIGCYIIWRSNGLYAICSLVAIIGTFEYSRLTFKNLALEIKDSTVLRLRTVFFVLSLSVYATTVWAESFAMLCLAISACIFIALTLYSIRTTELSAPSQLTSILRLQNAGLMGLIYCGVFTGFTVRTLTLPDGDRWLLGLLLVVFSGDTFAYLAGVSFGRNKLLEVVSPKKTIEGSLGGLFGSALAGLLMGLFFIKAVPLSMMVLTALLTGLFAQTGDLFESLLKRVADVKDSGTLMPGHGGLLDRVDGVLFAAPVYYFLAKLIL